MKVSQFVAVASGIISHVVAANEGSRPRGVGPDSKWTLGLVCVGIDVLT